MSNYQSESVKGVGMYQCWPLHLRSLIQGNHVDGGKCRLEKSFNFYCQHILNELMINLINIVKTP